MQPHLCLPKQRVSRPMASRASACWFAVVVNSYQWSSHRGHRHVIGRGAVYADCANSAALKPEGAQRPLFFSGRAAESRSASHHLYQLIAVLRHALLDGLENSALLEHGALAVTLGLGSQALADGRDVDEASFEQVVVDDDLPGGPRREQAFPFVARDYPVARRLVGVALEDVAVEIGWIVRHRTRRRRRGGCRGPCVRRHHRRRPQDLVLCLHPLKVTLQPLVLRHGLVLSLLKLVKSALEILDMTLLAFPECTLAAVPG